MSSEDEILKEKQRWQKETLAKQPYRKDVKAMLTGVDLDVDVLYTPADINDVDYNKDLGFPGEFPFTRGVYPSMYRGRLWTMRQYSGFDTPEESNKRYKYLLEQGNKGLSVAFDLPSQMGYDSDNQDVEEEVGRVGVAISTLKDMEILFDDIPLEEVTTSFTINGIAATILAMYVALADKRGLDREKIGGTIQNDILKEYAARGTYLFPPKPSMRLVADTIEYCMQSVPRFNPISISGGHYRSGGASMIQEVAFTLANAIAYVESVVERGIGVDQFAPRLSFLLVNHCSLFEEVCKYRATRRIWAGIMKDKFGAKDPKSMMFRVYSAGCGDVLTHSEPENNIIRLTLMTLAGVLGGAQSYFTPGYDEAYALPTEKTARLGLRTQQIIAHESGVTNTVDPLAGSYYVEWLTNKIEKEVKKYMALLEKKGNMVDLVEQGYIQSEMARSAYGKTKMKMTGEKIVVGVNMFTSDEEQEQIQIHKPDPAVIEKRRQSVAKVKLERDNEKVRLSLEKLKAAARGKENLMPYLIDTVKAYGSVEEIATTLKNVFGEFEEPKI